MALLRRKGFASCSMCGREFTYEGIKVYAPDSRYDNNVDYFSNELFIGSKHKDGKVYCFACEYEKGKSQASPKGAKSRKQTNIPVI